MSMIQIRDLTFSYENGAEPVFEHFNADLDPRWNLALCARNGRGKTTLLRLLLGELQGSGTISSPVEFAYFPCPVSEEEQLVADVLQEIAPQPQQWEFVRELNALKLDEDILWRIYSTLSYGEKTKVQLAALFLNEGKCLLIDEPANHLDTVGRQVLSAYLHDKHGFILVSHDRVLLDGCTDHVLAINRSSVELVKGSYSSWKSDFISRQNTEDARNTRLKKEISAMQKSSRQSADWSGRIEASKYGNAPVDRGFIGHRAAKMMKRSKSIERRRQKAIEEKSALLQDFEESESLRLSPRNDLHGTLISAHDVVCFYDSRPVNKPVSFPLHEGDRIVLDGSNGSGKSTLLKLIREGGVTYTGELFSPSRLIISWVPQDSSFLKGTLREFAEESKIDESLFKSILRKLGFDRTQFEVRMEDFSAGQKKKVLIARSLCESAHLYIWDEPLNYIDIESREQIEALIQEYHPAMLLVEHDLAFQHAVADEIVPVEKRIAGPKNRTDFE
ncbi:ribosomal protection-like ABC-F family protein [Allobaculum fili]|uniref:ribosomal protection-like ABC-F family protein n=2 Tax=Allobaculum TaxID=174708 RepID=UPI001E62F4F2|nr:ATP-binding cassette domain-containing protein [Allobaculum fili]